MGLRNVTWIGNILLPFVGHNLKTGAEQWQDNWASIVPEGSLINLTDFSRNGLRYQRFAGNATFDTVFSTSFWI